MTDRYNVAVVQASPIVFDRDRTLDKLHALASDAARQGARVVLFPEAFVSAYPRGLDFGAYVGGRTDEGRDDFRRYWESSVDVPGQILAVLMLGTLSVAFIEGPHWGWNNLATIGCLAARTSSSRFTGR